MRASRYFVLSGAAASVLGASALLAGFVHPLGPSRPSAQVQLEIAKIYFEFNSTDNDLGVHVSLDGEDWKELKIKDPTGHVLFEVDGRGPYRELGMTELFFEGAEPSLDEVPLDDLL